MASRAIGVLVLAAALSAILLGPEAASAAGPYEYTGTVAGCNYNLSLNSDSKTVSAQASGCVGGALSAELDAKYAGETVTLTTIKGTGTIEGHSISIEEGLSASFGVGADIDALVHQIELGADQSVAQAAIDRLMQSSMRRLQALALGQLVSSAVSDPNGPLRALSESENELCAAFDGGSGHTNDNCAPSECPDAPDTCTKPPAAVTADVGDGSGLGDSATDALCPVVNAAQSAAVFVCVPSYIAGNLDTGSKPLVILPGGALIALPVGGSNLLDLSSTPTLSSSKAIVSMGGLLVGYNLKLKAPEIAFGAGLGAMIGKLSLEGKSIDLGSVDLDDAVGALPGAVTNDPDLKSWKRVAGLVEELHIPGAELPTSGTFAAPVRLAAAAFDVKATSEVALGSSSVLDASARGGAGGLGGSRPGGLPNGEAPGGAHDEYGGSHGGYGGYPLGVAGRQEWDLWHDPGLGGRGPTYDDPFAPTLPGNGGSGDWDVDNGAPGGGAVRIDAPKATVRIDGTIDAAGEATGSVGGFDHDGAAGAGGSVYLTAKTLAGSGDVGADGGGYPPENVNGGGGDGGGGRVAALYGSAEGWHGSLHAHGGFDEQFPGLAFKSQFKGSGGAGTVFTRAVKFKEDGSVEAGTGTFPAGTLTIDGGRPVAYYPPPDGTPLADAWGDPGRRLVLAGEARAYALHPHFGEIDLTGGSVLTAAPDVQRLEVEADTLSVDATSRVAMSGHGAAGGPAWTGDGEDPDEGAGGVAPGQTPSARGFGGSHGGAGGATTGESPDGHAGSTYDDPAAPSLPGGGGAGGTDTDPGASGGGVLDVEVGALRLDGLLSADGEDTNGPTVDDPAPFYHEGGAGAGGSVLVHAERLSGAGAVRADGGWSCLEEGDGRLLEQSSLCGFTGGFGGGGGGGRVAVYATECGWNGTLSAAGGGDEGAQGEDVARTRGGDGTALLTAAGGDCTEPAPPPGGGGGDGSGPDGSGPVDLFHGTVGVKVPAVLQVKGKFVLVPISCRLPAGAPSGCNIRVKAEVPAKQLTAGGAGRGSQKKPVAKGPVTIASGQKTVAPGQTSVLKLVLAHKALAALAAQKAVLAQKSQKGQKSLKRQAALHGYLWLKNRANQKGVRRAAIFKVGRSLKARH